MTEHTTKVPYEQLPIGALEPTARAMEAGNKANHEPFDWMEGRSWLYYFAKTIRHLFKWYMGEDIDPKTGVPHLGHASADILILLDYTMRNVGTDDRPIQQIKRENDESHNPSGVDTGRTGTP